MANTDKWSNPREAALDRVRDAIEEKKQTIDSGPLEGTEVVSIEDISEAFRVPLEPVSDFTAEVRTPGLVYVAGVCPACKEIANLRMDLSTELRIETGSRHLRLKGKSKEVTHYCGQRTMADHIEGQTTFDIEDIVNRGEDDPISATELQALLVTVGVEATIEAIDSWSEPDRETVRAWAVAVIRESQAVDDETRASIEVPERPNDILAAFDAVEVEEEGDQEEDGDDGDGTTEAPGGEG